MSKQLSLTFVVSEVRMHFEIFYQSLGANCTVKRKKEKKSRLDI